MFMIFEGLDHATYDDNLTDEENYDDNLTDDENYYDNLTNDENYDDNLTPITGERWFMMPRLCTTTF